MPLPAQAGMLEALQGMSRVHQPVVLLSHVVPLALMRMLMWMLMRMLEGCLMFDAHDVGWPGGRMCRCPDVPPFDALTL